MKQLLFLFFGLSSLYAQDTYRPELFFREDWKETPAEIPLSQKHVDNTNLMVTLHGPGLDSLKKSNHDKPIDDPYYVWSGLCLGNWMVSLQHRNLDVNLSGFAKIRFRSKQSGLRLLRITLQQENGKWLISDKAVSSSKDWLTSEFNFQDITWYQLNPDSIVEMGLAKNPQLGQIRAIGFTDLMPGGKSPSCSRLDWIEVYGNAVNR